MKRLHEKVNIIPLIAKADTLTPEECQQFKKQVGWMRLNSWVSHTIRVICSFSHFQDNVLQCISLATFHMIIYAVLQITLENNSLPQFSPQSSSLLWWCLLFPWSLKSILDISVSLSPASLPTHLRIIFMNFQKYYFLKGHDYISPLILS